MPSELWPLQVFDPNAGYTVIERKLPHWSQAGTICFITWRTKDSIPRPVLNRWYADRDNWLRKHGIKPQTLTWKLELQSLDSDLRGEFVRTFSDRWHRQLDSCHGKCVLRAPSIAQIVADSLHKFDGERYELTDFIVMPNHVHLLAAFASEEGMLGQCNSWKHFTARQINLQTKGSGEFWQQDGFDHLLRSEDQFFAIRKYIALNGERAHLSPESYLHYSKLIRGAGHAG